LFMGVVEPEEVRVVHIENTKKVKYVEILENLVKETEVREDMETRGELKPM